MMNRNAIAKGSAVAALGVLILAGATGIYFYTMAPSPKIVSTTTNTITSSTSSLRTTSSSGSTGPSGGTCIKNDQGQCQTPQGTWAQYLGYIPAGYTLSPHYAIAPTYPCPSGMDATQCALFRQSCGNGVCDPNESCATCAIDCGIPGQLTCDPYTGRAGAPVSVCQLGGGGGGGG